MVEGSGFEQVLQTKESNSQASPWLEELVATTTPKMHSLLMVNDPVRGQNIPDTGAPIQEPPVNHPDKGLPMFMPPGISPNDQKNYDVTPQKNPEGKVTGIDVAFRDGTKEHLDYSDDKQIKSVDVKYPDNSEAHYRGVRANGSVATVDLVDPKGTIAHIETREDGSKKFSHLETRDGIKRDREYSPDGSTVTSDVITYPGGRVEQLVPPPEQK